jgi:hypothetical protein
MRKNKILERVSIPSNRDARENRLAGGDFGADDRLLPPAKAPEQPGY